MKKRVETKAPGAQLAALALRSLVISVSVTLLLLLAAAWLIASKIVGEGMADALLLFSVGAANTVGGIHAASGSMKNTVAAGALSGLIFLLAVLVLTLLLPVVGTEEGILVRLMIASVAGGVFGGVLKLDRKSKKSRLRKSGRVKSR